MPAWVGGGGGRGGGGGGDNNWKPRTVEDSIDVGVHPAVAAMRIQAASKGRTVEDAIVGRKVEHILGQNRAPGLDLAKTSDPSYNPVNFFKQASKLGVNPLENVMPHENPALPKKEGKEKKSKKSKKKDKSKKSKKKKKHKKRKSSSSSSSSSSSESSSSSSSSKKKKRETHKKSKKDLVAAAVVAASKRPAPANEEDDSEAEKREKKAKKREDKERARAQANAERIELERRLFGVNPMASALAAGPFCPTRPEVGQMQMEMDEHRARMLCGECRGGKQHSGMNM